MCRLHPPSPALCGLRAGSVSEEPPVLGTLHPGCCARGGTHSPGASPVWLLAQQTPFSFAVSGAERAPAGPAPAHGGARDRPRVAGGTASSLQLARKGQVAAASDAATGRPADGTASSSARRSQAAAGRVRRRRRPRGHSRPLCCRRRPCRRWAPSAASPARRRRGRRGPRGSVSGPDPGLGRARVGPGTVTRAHRARRAVDGPVTPRPLPGRRPGAAVPRRAPEPGGDHALRLLAGPGRPSRPHAERHAAAGEAAGRVRVGAGQAEPLETCWWPQGERGAPVLGAPWGRPAADTGEQRLARSRGPVVGRADCPFVLPVRTLVLPSGPRPDVPPGGPPGSAPGPRGNVAAPTSAGTARGLPGQGGHPALRFPQPEGGHLGSTGPRHALAPCGTSPFGDGGLGQGGA